MKRSILVLAALALLLGGVGRARAGIIVPNSTYDVFVFEVPTDNDGVASSTFTVNGTPQNFTFNGVTITVKESEASLGGGQFTVTIDLSASQDIYPDGGVTTDTTDFAIGGFSDPLKLTTPAELTSAVVTYTQGNGNVLATANDIGGVTNPNPWDGFFDAPGIAQGLTNSSAHDIQDINVVFTLTALATPAPEPASLTLLGLGVAGIAGYAWRRRR
jgi:hypothetical protein